MDFTRPCMRFLYAALFSAMITNSVEAHQMGDQDPNRPSLSLDELSRMDQTAKPSPTDQAISKWAGRLKQDSHDEDAWVNLGDALMQKARETQDALYPNTAESAYQKALEHNPEQVAALAGLSWVHGNRHEFDQSIEWANQALALDPYCGEAYGLLGDAAVEMGNYDLAFDSYQKMLDISPDLSSYSRSAHLLFLAGDTNRAAGLLQKAIEQGSPYAENVAWCRAQLARIFWNNGAYGPAEQQLLRALQEAPNHFDALLMMGKVKASLREHEASIDCYQKALAVAPNYEALVSLGDLYALTGQPEKAKELYARVEDLHRKNHESGMDDDIFLARYYADHDLNLESALALAEAGYEKQKSIGTADTMAWCYYKNGRYEEAEKAIREALKQNTPDAAIHFHAGMIHAKRGNPGVAQQYLSSALSLNPCFHPVYATIAVDTLKEISKGLAQKPE